MNNIWVIVSTLLLAVVGTSNTFADTITVCPNGCDYSSIQNAMDASSDGDLIQIEAGTYYEHSLNPEGKTITVSGATEADGSPAVTVDANSSGRGILVDSGEGPGTVFENLVITKGLFPGDGGGIRCNASSPTFRNCTIMDNSASQFNGGGIFCYGSNVMIIGCTIRNNTCGGDGGGIHCMGSSEPRIINTIICGNHPDQVYGDFMDLGNNIISDTCSLLGACCIDSDCTISTLEDCEDAGGSFEGIDTDCDDKPCYIPPAEGACCTNDICRDSFEDECLDWGGQWLGEGSSCGSSFCPTSCLGDANSDGVINVNDILVVISQYGVTCP